MPWKGREGKAMRGDEKGRGAPGPAIIPRVPDPDRGGVRGLLAMCHAPEMEDGAVMGEMGDGRWGVECRVAGSRSREGESEGDVGVR